MPRPLLNSVVSSPFRVECEIESLKKRTRRKILRYFLVLVIAWLVVTAGPVIALRWLDPPTTSFILQYRLAAWFAEKSSGVKQRWIDLEKMGSAIPLAVVASEDQKFPAHFGFDLDSIQDALLEHGQGERLRGASTISQQTAKNLFLWSERSYLRKGIEAYFTALIELLWSKRRILEVYLNIAEFGGGIYGVSAATERYYGRSPASLSDWEAALLAVVLPSPRRMDPGNPSDYMWERSEWVMQQMRRLRSEGALSHILR